MGIITYSTSDNNEDSNRYLLSVVKDLDVSLRAARDPLLIAYGGARMPEPDSLMRSNRFQDIMMEFFYHADCLSDGIGSGC